MKKLLRLALSLTLVLAMVMGSVPAVAFAGTEKAAQVTVECDESQIGDGMFYIPERTIVLQEDGEGATLRVLRKGDSSKAAKLRLTFTDYTASFGKDYKVVLKSGGEVFNLKESKSILDVYLENPDEVNEYNEADQILDGSADKERELTDDEQKELEEIGEELLGEVVPDAKSVTVSQDVSSLKNAKSNAIGLPSDKTAMDGIGVTTDSLGYLTDSIEELSEALSSCYIILDFAPGQTEASIEITPVNNLRSEGNRSTAITLSAEDASQICAAYYGTTVQITDDEKAVPATISFSNAAYNPDTEEPYVTVVLERTGNMTEVVSVMLDTADGSAKSGRDYSQVHAEVVFPFGVTKRTINIPVNGEHIEGIADFTVSISEPTGCKVGKIDKAKITLTNETPIYLMGIAIDLDTYITGQPLTDGENKVKITSSNNGNNKSYANINGNYVKLHVESGDAGGGTVHIYGEYELNENHWDYNGIEIEWSRDSSKPNYGRTYIYQFTGASNVNEIKNTDSERWGTRTEKLYFPVNKDNKETYNTRHIQVRLDRSKGCWGTSPTLEIYNIRPILRPFQISQKGADPVLVYRDGLYKKNTEVSGLEDMTRTLLNDATHTGEGTLTTITGGVVTVQMARMDNNIAYIRYLKIVNEKTGESLRITADQPEGTNTVSFELTNSFLELYKDYIDYAGSGTGVYGLFTIQPVLGLMDSKVTVEDNEAVKLSYKPSFYSVSRGDKVDVTIDVINPARSCNKIEVIPQDGTPAYYLEDKDGDGVVSFVIMGPVTIRPYVEVGGNSLIVKVAESDVSQFDGTQGIFTVPYTTVGGYRYYTVQSEEEFKAAVWTELLAKPNSEFKVARWSEPVSGYTYSQNTFYYEPKATGVEDNILTLSIATKDKNLPMAAKAYWTDSAIGDVESPSFWLPATGLSLMLDNVHYGIVDDKGTLNAVGAVPVKVGDRVRVKMNANGRISYKERVVEAKSDKLDFGAIVVSPLASEVPHVSVVTVENTSGLLLSEIPIDDYTITNIKAYIEDNGREYYDSDGVRHTENVKQVEFLVYDKNHNLKTTLTMKVGDDDEVPSRATSSNLFEFLGVFPKNHRTEYASSDLLYVRVTTDRWIGNGFSEDESGNPVASELMRETIYAPVRTRYSFVETNPEVQRTYDMDIASLEEGFYSLPIIGSLSCSINIKKFNLQVRQIPNGMRLLVGVIPKSWTDSEHITGGGDPMSDTGAKYSSPKDFGQAFKDMKNVIEAGGKDMWKGGPQYLGMTNWTIKPFVGLYMDFGIHYETDGTIKNNNFVFLGGGGYVGISGYFRYTFYMLVYGVPVYTGFDVTLTVAGQFGAAANKDDDRTYEALAAGSLDLADWEFDTMVCAELNVNAYLGVGVCGTAGARGGVALTLAFIYYPTMTKYYPDISQTGWQITGQIKVWIDVVLMSIPIPCYKFTDEKWGYFKDIQKYNSESERALFAAINKSDDKLEVFDKVRSDSNSNWVGSSPILQATLEPQSSRVLLAGGYDNPDIRAKAFDSNGDGTDDKVMMVYLDDDKARPDNQRTVLMMSIYDIAKDSWSKPVKVQDDGTADFTPDLCVTKNGVLISWTSRDPKDAVDSYADQLKTLEIYCCEYTPAGGLGEIVQLTDDELFDISPYAIADDRTGDILVHYTKSEVKSELITGQDIIKAGWTLYNEGQPMYMLYDGASKSWVRDKYFENELADGANVEGLLENWGGQRFLNAAIAGVASDPVIYDFHAATMELGFYPDMSTLKTLTALSMVNVDSVIEGAKDGSVDIDENKDLQRIALAGNTIREKTARNYGVYSFTIDMDNNLATDGDREMYVQIYDFETHSTTEPVRITNNSVSDSNPWLKGDYLFWTEEDDTVRYIDLAEAFSHNMVKKGNQIYLRDEGDAFGTISNDWGSGVVDVKRFEDSNDIPEIGGFVPFVDDEGNIYVVWQQLAQTNGNSQQELFVSSLTADKDFNSRWSDAHRLTNTASYDDLPVIVSIGKGELMMVNNQYKINLNNDIQETEDVRMVATKLKMVSSLDLDAETKNTAPEVVLSGDPEKTDDGVCKVKMTLHNSGLRGSESFKYSYQLFRNGTAAGDKVSVSKSCDADGVFIPAGDDYSEIITFTGLDKLALGEYSVRFTYQEEDFAEQSKEIKLFSGKPEYVLSGITSVQDGEEWVVSGQIANLGSGPSSEDDLMSVVFNDLYFSGNKETFAEIGVEELAGYKDGEHLSVGAERAFTLRLEVSDKLKTKGFVNACALFTDADGESLGDGEEFSLGLDYPCHISVSGADRSKVFLVVKDTETNLKASYGGSDFFGGGKVIYAVADPGIASIEDGKLTAKEIGETLVEMTVDPYGGHDSFTLKVVESLPAGRFVDVTRSAYYFNAVNFAVEKGITNGTDAAHFSPNNIISRAEAVTMLWRLFGSPEAENTESKYSDVKSGSYYEKAVLWATEKGIVNGVGGGRFDPNGQCDRAQIVTMLWRAAGSRKVGEDVKGFADVKKGAYYEEAAKFAVKLGITNGKDGNKFAPSDLCSRAEAVTFIYRLYEVLR